MALFLYKVLRSLTAYERRELAGKATPWFRQTEVSDVLGLYTPFGPVQLLVAFRFIVIHYTLGGLLRKRISNNKDISMIVLAHYSPGV
jgi:hypothetical protein